MITSSTTVNQVEDDFALLLSVDVICFAFALYYWSRLREGGGWKRVKRDADTHAERERERERRKKKRKMWWTESWFKTSVLKGCKPHADNGEKAENAN